MDGGSHCNWFQSLKFGMLSGHKFINKEVTIVLQKVLKFQKNFDSYNFVHVKRYLNTVAHVLAGKGCCGVSSWLLPLLAPRSFD